MAKVFNVTAVCIPEEHYMVNIDKRLKEIKSLVDGRKYFTINRARQYGKTTTLIALEKYLSRDYYVVSMDFQTFDAAKFKNGNVFSLSFASSFLQSLRRSRPVKSKELEEATAEIEKNLTNRSEDFTLKELFECLSGVCAVVDKPVVLMIDEIDSAADNQVFLDLLSQFRAYYIRRATQPTFQSVILAGVYDIKNLKRKIRPEEDHKVNSPWNIATDFQVEMSFDKEEIAGMLKEYEADYHTGMNIDEIAGLIYNYTSGYPFLVSKLCKLMDENVYRMSGYDSKDKVWTKRGFDEAIRMLLAEKNPLFESLVEKLTCHHELDVMLNALLFSGRGIAYNPDEFSIDIATMFGFIKNQNGVVVIANRIFETRLYNFYLSTSQMQGLDIYKASLQDRSQFVVNGYLDMRLILEKFVSHFNDLYGDSSETFLEDEGRKYFLLYLRPIINGTGNYYIESRTRELRRTDVIVDYHGKQYIIEMKIWHGDEYNHRGEQQLIEYLDYYHTNMGYMVSFNFNKKKQIGVREIVVGEKILVEAVV